MENAKQPRTEVMGKLSRRVCHSYRKAETAEGESDGRLDLRAAKSSQPQILLPRQDRQRRPSTSGEQAQEPPGVVEERIWSRGHWVWEQTQDTIHPASQTDRQTGRCQSYTPKASTAVWSLRA